jgi:hypothetical protein
VQASPLPVIGGSYEFSDWLVDTSQVVGAAGMLTAAQDDGLGADSRL